MLTKIAAVLASRVGHTLVTALATSAGIWLLASYPAIHTAVCAAGI